MAATCFSMLSDEVVSYPLHGFLYNDYFKGVTLVYMQREWRLGTSTLVKNFLFICFYTLLFSTLVMRTKAISEGLLFL